MRPTSGHATIRVNERSMRLRRAISRPMIFRSGLKQVRHRERDALHQLMMPPLLPSRILSIAS